ncbi:uncharacterized protein J3D65DRAFT_375760 [Phyllosticta citribraziliensis]|uniref:Septin-type G domain-containing protein n=1 Tax=Phyllosticta citribraziliensis TaxID=989973 RepID=A0ABR1LQ44_9PEZI
MAKPNPTTSSAAPAAAADLSRHSSFSFLRRQKSTDGAKMGKKAKQQAKDDLLRQQREQQEALAKRPPQLPEMPPMASSAVNTTFGTFGGDNNHNHLRPDSYHYVSHKATSFSRPLMDRRNPSSASPLAVPPPIPQSPSSATQNYIHSSEPYDPAHRSESMTHRGRSSYASSIASPAVNSPRRVRRRKDPTAFNVLVIGASGCGKSSFVNFLKTSLALPKPKHAIGSPPPRQHDPNSPFTSHYLETEIDGERVGLTLWDSQGLERSVVDLQLREMTSFIETKFDETFAEEQKVVRSAGFRDTHIHCVFLLLDPARLDANIAHARGTPGSYVDKFAVRPNLVGSLDEDLDLQVLRGLQGKTTVIPVVSKADSITTAHMAYLKRSVWDGLKQAKLDLLEALDLDDESDVDPGLDDDTDTGYAQSDDDVDQSDMINKLVDRSDSDSQRSSTSASSPPPQSPVVSKAVKQGRRLSAQLMAAAPDDDELPYLPLSIISPDMYEPHVIGRRFPWGFADPNNNTHCDFLRLKESVFSEWRGELREAARERWYEGWRTNRLKRLGGGLSGAGTPRRRADYASSPGPQGTPRNGNGNAMAYKSVSTY